MFIKAKKRNRKNRDKSIGNAWLAAVQIGGEGAAAKQAAEPMGYLNYSESAFLIRNRLSEGAKRMSLSRRASEQRKRVITSAPWACCLREIEGRSIDR